MPKLALAAAIALLLAATPALAENGGATDRQSGGISGSQSERMGAEGLARATGHARNSTDDVVSTGRPSRHEQEHRKGGLDVRQ